MFLLQMLRNSVAVSLACLLGSVRSFRPISLAPRQVLIAANPNDAILPEQRALFTRNFQRDTGHYMATANVDEAFHAAYNFGPASSRDAVVFSAERPGNDPDSKTTPVSNEQVAEWCNFMKEQGVTNVVVLLDDNEFGIYKDGKLLDIYVANGMRYLWQSMDEGNASDKIYDFIRDVQANGGKVVTHCTGGIGRCGRVAAGWLVCEYGLSAEEATAETLAQAKRSGVTRAGNAEKLQAWLG